MNNNDDLNNTLAMVWKMQRRIIQIQAEVIDILENNPEDIQGIDRRKQLLNELKQFCL